MWGKQVPAKGTGFQVNQLMEWELLSPSYTPLPHPCLLPPQFSRSNTFTTLWVCTKCYNGLAIRGYIYSPLAGPGLYSLVATFHANLVNWIQERQKAEQMNKRRKKKRQVAANSTEGNLKWVKTFVQEKHPHFSSCMGEKNYYAWQCEGFYSCVSS